MRHLLQIIRRPSIALFCFAFAAGLTLPSAALAQTNETAPRVEFSETGQADWDRLEPSLTDEIAEAIEWVAANPSSERSVVDEETGEGARWIRTSERAVLGYRPIEGGILVLGITPSPPGMTALPEPPLVKLSVRPDDPQVVREAIESGGALLKAGSYAEAELAYSTAIERGAAGAKPFIARGHCRLVQGKCNLALEDFRAARQFDFQLATPVLGLARTYERQGNKLSAAQWYRVYANSKAEDVIPRFRDEAKAASIRLRPGIWQGAGETKLRSLYLGGGATLAGAAMTGIGAAMANSGGFSEEGLLGVLLALGGMGLGGVGLVMTDIFAIQLTNKAFGGHAPWYAVAPGYAVLGALPLAVLAGFLVDTAEVFAAIGIGLAVLPLALIPLQAGIAIWTWHKHKRESRKAPSVTPLQPCLDGGGSLSFSFIGSGSHQRGRSLECGPGSCPARIAQPG